MRPNTWVVRDKHLQHANAYATKTKTLTAMRSRDREQTDLKLKPAIEAQQQRQQQGTQQRLSQYFEPSRRVASIRSVRMANAVHKLGKRSSPTHTHPGTGKTRAGSDTVEDRTEPRVADDTPLDAAAVVLQQQKEQRKAAAGPAKKRPKPKPKGKHDSTHGDRASKSNRGRSGYMIFLCVVQSCSFWRK